MPTEEQYNDRYISAYTVVCVLGAFALAVSIGLSGWALYNISELQAECRVLRAEQSSQRADVNARFDLVSKDYDRRFTDVNDVLKSINGKLDVLLIRNSKLAATGGSN